MVWYHDFLPVYHAEMSFFAKADLQRLSVLLGIHLHPKISAVCSEDDKNMEPFTIFGSRFTGATMFVVKTIRFLPSGVVST